MSAQHSAKVMASTLWIDKLGGKPRLRGSATLKVIPGAARTRLAVKAQALSGAKTIELAVTPGDGRWDGTVAPGKPFDVELVFEGDAAIDAGAMAHVRLLVTDDKGATQDLAGARGAVQRVD